MGRKALIFLIAAALAVGWSGCSTAGPIPEPSPEATDQRLADSLPELFQLGLDTMDPSPEEREEIERAIVAGRIDPADYNVSRLRYVSCMEQRGYQPAYRITSDGLYIELPDTSEDDQSALNAAMSECSYGFSVMDVLYRIQQTNPDLLADYRLLAVRCLIEGGFVDADYTVEDLDRNIEMGMFPFNRYVGRASECLYAAGYTSFLG
ncbi:MAG: hypothetical protein LBJ44_10210 [Propionibacteriaceae bacterium]|jgi:hypothetical protein|nr:hypothetical protein [Propionibacteriaceae bacterium]